MFSQVGLCCLLKPILLCRRSKDFLQKAALPVPAVRNLKYHHHVTATTTVTTTATTATATVTI